MNRAVTGKGIECSEWAVMQVFAARLRELRKAAGLTQAELGRRSGLSLAGVTRLEGGGRAPRLDTLFQLARGLDVDPRDLVTFDENELVSDPEVLELTKFLNGEPVAVARATIATAHAIANCYAEATKKKK